MRHYLPNSPEAAARIVAMTLVADGQLDASELAALQKQGALERLGIDQTRFREVLCEFCDDLLRSGRCDGWQCEVDSASLATLLGELDDPAKQKATLRTMFDVIRADGRLARGESQVFWEALQQWRLKLSDITATTNAAPPKRRKLSAPGKIAGAASPASIRTPRPRRASHPWRRR